MEVGVLVILRFSDFCFMKIEHWLRNFILIQISLLNNNT